MEQEREAKVGMRGSRGGGTVVLGEHSQSKARGENTRTPSLGIHAASPVNMPLDLHLDVGNQLDSANVRKYIMTVGSFAQLILPSWKHWMDTKDTSFAHEQSILELGSSPMTGT